MAPERPRRTHRKSYTIVPTFIPGVDDISESSDSGAAEDNGAGPSKRRRRRLTPIEDPVSDSEFAPSADGDDMKESASQNSDSDASDNVERDEDEDDPGQEEDAWVDEDGLPLAPRTTSSSKGSKQDMYRARKTDFAKSHAPAIQTLHVTKGRAGNRTPAINTPNHQKSNRNRPLLIYVSMDGPARRLAHEPRPFDITPSMNTRRAVGLVAERLSKASSQSMYIGPSWELIEDLAWYKERHVNEMGINIRPIVHDSVKVSKDSIRLFSQKFVIIRWLQ